MALSEDLPLYRDTLRLLNLLIPLSQGFPRFFRYNMGNRMIELNLDMCVWNSKSLQKGNMPGWPLSWIRSASRVQGGNNTVRKELHLHYRHSPSEESSRAERCRQELDATEKYIGISRFVGEG
nr:MAG TPA: 23S rRNA-intervening sequence protein [Caudoviricetes sp.]